jgi:hypothetical protein
MAPRKIFLSHSKHDREILNFFMASFGLVDGIVPQVIEFEELQAPPWAYIRDEMMKSKAIFILLGENVVKTNIHTQNWISFEVGLACALNKEVWVFEQINVDVHFPIPYLHYYFQYDPSNDNTMKKIREIIKIYSDIPEGEQFSTDGIILTCPADSCRVEFRIPLFEGRLVLPSIISCPACRRKIKFRDDLTYNLVEEDI